MLIVNLAIIGTGPAALYFLHQLSQKETPILEIQLFEKADRLGCGMPYGKHGAGKEHVTNVSANEIPALPQSLESWINQLSDSDLLPYGIDKNHFNVYRVLPRLLFGNYLEDQFKLVLEVLKRKGIRIDIKFNSEVVDIENKKDQSGFTILNHKNEKFEAEYVILCTGHIWSKVYEDKIKNYFDSPYPPSKIHIEANFPVALKGSSLTAVDAIRTLARKNGAFSYLDSGYLSYQKHQDKPNFKIYMHSRSGLLPDVRIHLDNSQLGMGISDWPNEFRADSKDENTSFISLDEVFEQNFKHQIRQKDPDFYSIIKDDSLEEFVDRMMEFRKSINPFNLLEAEYKQAQKSIKTKTAISWKEALAVLSYALNYPAKYFSAEDTHRLHTHLMPLISVIIAFLPQDSTLELLALHQAGVLDMVVVDSNSWVEANDSGGATYHYVSENKEKKAESFSLYIDCTGQKSISYENFPFPTLRTSMTVSPARLKFRDQSYAAQLSERKEGDLEHIQDDRFYLRVPGVAINDFFQAIDQFGATNERLFLMSVPLIAGFNPDYSGLDFCETAAKKIIQKF